MTDFFYGFEFDGELVGGLEVTASVSSLASPAPAEMDFHQLERDLAAGILNLFD